MVPDDVILHPDTTRSPPLCIFTTSFRLRTSSTPLELPTPGIFRASSFCYGFQCCSVLRHHAYHCLGLEPIHCRPRLDPAALADARWTSVLLQVFWLCVSPSILCPRPDSSPLCIFLASVPPEDSYRQCQGDLHRIETSVTRSQISRCTEQQPPLMCTPVILFCCPNGMKRQPSG